jgi:hypothetical protein
VIICGSRNELISIDSNEIKAIVAFIWCINRSRNERISKLKHQDLRLLSKVVFMKNFVIKRPKLNFNNSEASYLRNFKLAHINWELNRQEDRLFSQEERLIHSIRKGSRVI